MPRPRKRRNVCCLPDNTTFTTDGHPENDDQMILMTVEEYETIRLIDYEGLTQEECAERMNVARTTVQRIYNTARHKISKHLVFGDMLKIDGGDYVLCNQRKDPTKCCQCSERQ